VVTLAATLHNQKGELVLTGEQKILLAGATPERRLPERREKNRLGPEIAGLIANNIRQIKGLGRR
jgi:hypothetical protein